VKKAFTAALAEAFGLNYFSVRKELASLSLDDKLAMLPDLEAQLGVEIEPPREPA
jgi:hypothetical protein